MKKIIFAILFLTGCTTFISCKKETITNNQPTIVPVQVQANSKIFFWAKPYIYDYWDYEPIIDGDPIKISINNETKLFNYTHYFMYGGPSPSQCFEANTVRFDIRPGTYTWVATRGNAKVSGFITIGAYACISQEIVITH
ncbi:MAG: hypothetical protein H0W75_03420 [Chitinophagaceae bacterium]|nr:hypothetical protein [Chitinophagaceae bacterium]